jgi:hypothetical protein
MNEDKIVTQLTDIGKHEKDKPNLIALRGYLGKSPHEGSMRLYLNAALTEYLELTAESMINPQKVPPTDTHPFESTVVWLDRNATVTYNRKGSEEEQAPFLAGEITSNYLPNRFPNVHTLIGDTPGFNDMGETPGSACCESKPPCGMSAVTC